MDDEYVTVELEMIVIEIDPKPELDAWSQDDDSNNDYAESGSSSSIVYGTGKVAETNFKVGALGLVEDLSDTGSNLSNAGRVLNGHGVNFKHTGAAIGQDGITLGEAAGFALEVGA